MRIRIMSNSFGTKFFDDDTGEDITEHFAGVAWKWTPKGIVCQVALIRATLDVSAYVNKATVETPGGFHRDGPWQATFTDVSAGSSGGEETDADVDVMDADDEETDRRAEYALAGGQVLALPSPNGVEGADEL